MIFKADHTIRGTLMKELHVDLHREVVVVN
jgi:hypothetical protein